MIKFLRILPVTLLVGLSRPAWSLPAPDSISKCKINESLQVHSWKLLNNEPRKLYFRVINFNNPYGPWEYIQITKAEYEKWCRQKIVREDVILSYQNLDSSIFEDVSKNQDEPSFVVSGLGAK